MIQHVWENAKKTKGLDEILIATDDERILNAVNKFGGKVVLTNPDHKTGTDRIIEVLSGHSCEWVLNIQGDEPLISPYDLDKLIKKAQETKGVNAATLVQKFYNESSIKDPNIVKVVLDKKKHALYFSRSIIPFSNNLKNNNFFYWRHLGVYFFKRDFLINFHKWPQTLLEKTEELEQLRVLENGETFLCVEAQDESLSVDLPEHIKMVENLIKLKKNK